jgi:TolB-like protein
MGHDKQAQIEVKEALKRKPTLSLENWRGTLQYKDEVVIDQIIAYARKAGLPEHPPLKLPDKPSIAVLPFANMSGDPEQEWFSDGFTDELIGDLAKISDILVISRNSAFTYKGKQIKIAQIAKELNVRYVLEGSVQKSGDKVRIRAQLIDGKTDHHLWSESYDGVLNDIFDLQDKITGKIVSALAVQLSPSEQKRVAEKGTDNVLAYEVFLKGGAHFVKHTPKDLLQAIEYYKQAIKFDPNFGRAYAALGYTYLIGGNQGWSKKMGSDWGTMRLLARHYLEEAMKNPSPEAYALAGVLEIHTRNFQKSITFAEKAYNYAPNSADRMTGLAWILAFADRTEESIELLNKEMRIADPFGVKGTTAMSYIWIGVNHFSVENLEEAITNLEKGLSLNPKATNFSCFLAASHALLGHDIEAKKALAEYLKGRRHPPPIQSLYYSWPFKDSKVFDRFAQGLVKAGLRGDPKKYYKLNKENKLAGQEIRKLLFGNTFSGYVYGIKELKYSYDIRDDGELEYSYKGQTYTGKTWMEGDKICVLRENYYGGLKDCREIYRNPEGDELTKTEYFNVTDYGFFLFSVEK